MVVINKLAYTIKLFSEKLLHEKLLSISKVILPNPVNWVIKKNITGKETYIVLWIYGGPILIEDLVGPKISRELYPLLNTMGRC